MINHRYHRHQLIDWFSQEEIALKKVAVIGAGAVGNEVIKNLALLGVGEIQIFDFDQIEIHNLTRSVLFREGDVGRHKAAVAAERAMELDQNVKAIPIADDFWKKLRLSSLQDIDVVFCCVDNFEARIKCNTLCYLAGVDFINLGIDSRFASIESFPFSSSVANGCLECNLPDSVYRRISERYSCGHLKKVSFVEKKIPTTIITSTAAATFAVSIGLRLGSGDQGVEPTRVYVDTILGLATRSTLNRSKGCACCGRFLSPPKLVDSSREVGSLVGSAIRNATVVTSDPILVGYRIGADGDEKILFKNAYSFGSNFAESIAADPGSVSIEIRDQFQTVELANRFEGLQMPCKFAIVSKEDRVVVCEFDGESL